MPANLDSPPSAGGAKRWEAIVVCLVLALATIAVFGQAVHYGFITFDDDHYVDHNAPLEDGLSARGLAWALTTNLTHLNESAEYWEPLTLITRLADYQMYKFEPGGHHLTSILLHLATGLALYGALWRLTGASRRSALVAALFLLHPMHVEPALWLSARKDLVNGLFYILTLWAYGWYAARPNWRRYLLVCAAALAANMGKPMAVSLPFVLLLLDLWPLRRWPLESGDKWRHLLRLTWEKAPLFVLTFGVAALAVIVQKEIGALDVEDVLPLSWRLGNAALALATYVVKAFVPVRLVFFYPHPGRQLNVPLAVAAGVAVLAVSLLAGSQWRRRPWLTVGWFWFLVVLGPVLGLIQIGDQAMADRYSYLAFIGIFIAVVWQGAEWLHRVAPPWDRIVAWGLSTGAVVACGVLCFFQVRTWRSSETVFSHALAVNPDNYLAQYNLGAILLDMGRRDEAMSHFHAAIRLREPVLRRLMADADAAAQRGAYREAVPRVIRILLVMPWNAELHQRLGTWLALDHQSGKALGQFDAALKYRPDWIEPRISIAVVLIGAGQVPKAQGILRDVLVRDPANVTAREMLDSLAAGHSAP